jgi:hypothetical protein
MPKRRRLLAKRRRPLPDVFVHRPTSRSATPKSSTTFREIKSQNVLDKHPKLSSQPQFDSSLEMFWNCISWNFLELYF